MSSKCLRKFCNVCKESFNSKYFSQHKCRVPFLGGTDNVVVETKVSEATSANLQHENTEEEIGTEDDNHMNTENSDDKEIDEDSIQEDYIGDKEFEEMMNDFDIDENSNDMFSLVGPANLATWICLFLALWQYTFCITDTAMEVLIKFFYQLFQLLSNKFDIIKQISVALPPSLYVFHQVFLTHNNRSNFVKYVVCIKCFSLYELQDCFEVVGGIRYSKNCSHIENKNHHMKRYRKSCGQLLMMKIHAEDGRVKLHPFKTYCYKPLRESIQELLKRKGFEEKCELWRSLQSEEYIMSDVFDGAIWKDFNNPNKHDFFTKPRNYGLVLNADWFAPYKHIRNVSVGAIYIVLLNLPRAERFQRKNVILVGLIPNMSKEPPTNKFLEPLVKELLEAWEDGFELSSYDGTSHTYKVALLCIGCDIPAARKLCGFMGHAAVVGCSRCKKEFPGDIGERNYGGFERDQWVKRTTDEHRNEMGQINSCTSIGDRKALESKLGTRYSVFVELPYYDSIRMSVIDPMHNLFQGTGKKMIFLWQELGYLKKEQFMIIQNRIDSAIVPSDIGALPSKISSGFDGFTADEVKNFTLIFSLYALKGLIPKRDLECWRLFVIACHYVCNRVINKNHVMIADSYFLRFCKSFEELYGSERVTPNMHLHCHLSECIMDFGPIYSFWLFSFERYNGILGNIPTNKHQIEVQMMKRFIRDNALLRLDLPAENKENFCNIFNKLSMSTKQRGALSDVMITDYVPYLKMSSRLFNVENRRWFDFNLTSTVRKSTIYSFSQLELNCLSQTYKFLYPDYQITVPPSAMATTELYIAGEIYGSNGSRSSRSSNIVAYWCDIDGKLGNFNSGLQEPRPGQVINFLKHIIYVDKQPYEHHFALAKWYLKLEDDLRCSYGKLVQVYRNKHFENFGPASFIPVQRIKGKFVKVETRVRGQDVIVVLPRYRALDL